MTDLINFFHENNFFEEGVSYTMCIDNSCMDATGELITHCCISDIPHSHISHSHECTLPNGATKTESVSFDLERLEITKYGATKGIPSAYFVTYKINENDDWSFDGKDKITFKASYESTSSSQQTITVSIQKK